VYFTFNVRVSLDTALLLEVGHEAVKVLSSALEDFLGSLKNSHFTLDLTQHFLHLLVLVVLSTEVSSVLSEIVSLHVLSTLSLGVLSLLVGHRSFKSLLFQLQLLDLLLLLLLLLSEHSSLRLEDAQVIVLRGTLLKLVFQGHAVSLEALHIVGQALELTLSRHGLVQEHFDSLETFSLIVELSSEDFVLELAVLAGLSSEVLKHLIGTKVLSRNFFGIMEALLDGQNLLLIEFNHASQLAVLLVELGILFLLLSELGSSIEESLEVFLVRSALEEVDLGQELFLLLLELSDFLLQLGWVHALASHLIDVLMGSLELSLEILVHLEGLLHFLGDKELVGDRQRDEEFSGIGSSLELGQLSDKPVKEVLDGLLLSMHDIALEGRVKIARVAKNLEESANSLLGLILSLSLDIDGLVLVIEVAHDLVQ